MSSRRIPSTLHPATRSRTPRPPRRGRGRLPPRRRDTGRSPPGRRSLPRAPPARTLRHLSSPAPTASGRRIRQSHRRPRWQRQRRSRRQSRRCRHHLPILHRIRAALPPSRPCRYLCLPTPRLTRKCRCPRRRRVTLGSRGRCRGDRRPSRSRCSRHPRSHRSRPRRCLPPPLRPACCRRCPRCRSRWRRPCRC
jgi:hypothetical protein